MNKEDVVISSGIAAIGTVISHFGGMFTPLFFMLIAFELMDYVSGMIAALQHEGWSSKEAMRGAVKKFCYFFAVMVGFGFDFLLHDFFLMTGIKLDLPSVFGVMIMWFLLSTELISIVENMAQLGVNIPFIAPMLKLFRDKVSQLANKRKDDDK